MLEIDEEYNNFLEENYPCEVCKLDSDCCDECELEEELQGHRLIIGFERLGDKK